MTEPTPDEIVAQRVREVIENAVAGLDPADRAERIAHCREHDEHGVRMFPGADDDLIEFRWGGRTLALVHPDVLTVADLGPVQAEFVAVELPDTVPADWTEQ
jgi:hypothetical protein